MEMMEAYYYSQTQTSVSFSEQQVFDCYPTVSNHFNNCAEGNPNDCGGTMYNTAFKVINKLGNLETYDQDPYKGANCGSGGYHCPDPVGPTGQCANNGAWKFSSASLAEGNGEEQMSEDVLKSVLGVTVYAACEAWMQYESGVLTSDSCGSMYSTDHAVVVVGYNYNDGKPYWIIKNHWSESWGMNGYAHVAAGVNAFNIGTGTPYSFVTNVAGGAYPSGGPVPAAPSSIIPAASTAATTTSFIPAKSSEVATQTSDEPVVPTTTTHIDVVSSSLEPQVPTTTVSVTAAPSPVVSTLPTSVCGGSCSEAQGTELCCDNSWYVCWFGTWQYQGGSCDSEEKAACSHDVCTVGAPLDGICGWCAYDICAVDQYCCNNKWDSLCVSIASFYCPDVRC
ncbi:hypothetical protein BC830DRAFT_1158977 [Chytriomyces sp. MP71]|nr:hypothetical protein BC830DRAFT_1158977 [Chytriomyces sp. MP71]